MSLSTKSRCTCQGVGSYVLYMNTAGLSLARSVNFSTLILLSENEE